MSTRRVAAPDFCDLVRQALELRRQLTAADSWRANRLTAPAFLARALELAQLDEPQARGLRDRLAADPELASAWQVTQALGEGWRRPDVWDPHELTWHLPQPARNALLEAGIPARYLIGVAAHLAIELGGPDAFGATELAGEGVARLKRLQGELAALYAQIASSIRVADLEVIAHPDRALADVGHCQATIRGTPVAVASVDTLGERLTGWLVARGLAALPEPDVAEAA